MRYRLCSLILSLLLLSSALGAQQGVGRLEAEEAKLRFAATQHEIIAVLLEETQYQQIVVEFQKVLDLGLTDETPVVQEAWLIAQELSEVKEFATAHRVVDATLTRIGRQENRFTLLILKGRLFKQQGQLRRAIDTYREAQELQR